MNIVLSISVGEAIDKYSILSIKNIAIKDKHKLKSIQDEMDVIYPQIKTIINKYNYHYQCLLHINKEIWDLSEKVRDDNIDINYKNTLFLETFYKNDARFRIKNKFNKLSLSYLNEQKSYPGNIITFAAVPYENYIEKNHYIRYLSVCYDAVILLTIPESYNNIVKLFDNDPHIIISNINGINISNLNLEPINNLNDIIEPIPNLLNTFDFSSTYINCLSGGRLGDFIHSLYVAMCKYKLTGLKSNIYITDRLEYGGDCFSTSVDQTYKELYDIVIQQSYVKGFSIYNNEPIDFNLNNFRKSPILYSASWLQILSSSFNFKLLEEPWINIESNDIYKDTILIHQSCNTHRKIEKFLPILENIIKKNKCVFITCNPLEYASFRLKHLLPLNLKPNLHEMILSINSCKLFIGNQSSNLAIAMALFKPVIAEHTEGCFYTYQHYKNLYWITPHYNNLESIDHELLNL